MRLCVCDMFRCEVDMSELKVNKCQLFTCSLDQSRGKVVFLITLTRCSGVSITDLCTPLLDEPHERENMINKYVSFSSTLYFLLLRLYYMLYTHTSDCPSSLELQELLEESKGHWLSPGESDQGFRPHGCRFKRHVPSSPRFFSSFFVFTFLWSPEC